MKFHLYFFLFFNVFGIVELQAQTCTVGGAPFYQIDGDAVFNSAEEVFVFDNLTKYLGGITKNGITSVRISVPSDGGAPPQCGWILTMSIANGGGVTPVNNWQSNTFYGTGTTRPTINILQVRIDNGASSSTIAGIYQTFNNDGDAQVIIAANPYKAAGAPVAGTDTNGSGSDLTFPDEFAFVVDLRVNPQFNFSPGIYELNLNFRLEPR